MNGVGHEWSDGTERAECEPGTHVFTEAAVSWMRGTSGRLVRLSAPFVCERCGAAQCACRTKTLSESEEQAAVAAIVAELSVSERATMGVMSSTTHYPCWMQCGHDGCLEVVGAPGELCEGCNPAGWVFEPPEVEMGTGCSCPILVAVGAVCCGCNCREY